MNMNMTDNTPGTLQPDQVRQLLSDAINQLESASTIDDLKPILRAILHAQIDALPPPDYLGV